MRRYNNATENRIYYYTLTPEHHYGNPSVVGPSRVVTGVIDTAVELEAVKPYNIGSLINITLV